jgi:GDP-L-fucose synthase
VLAERVYVAGHAGLVGSALVRALRNAEYSEPITRTHQELDLTDQHAVRKFMAAEAPEVVFLAAARVGGIAANDTFRWNFIYDNLAIQTNVIGAALEHGVRKLVFFGSSCVYPKLAAQPIVESALLTGPLEPTNEPYAIAKIAGLKLVEAAGSQFGRSWLSLMPANLYGPGDNFDLNSSHVIPGMIRKFHQAATELKSGYSTQVTLWGNGTALREFLHVDDLARAAIFLLETGATGLYNVGSGTELTIRDLAEELSSIVGYEGEIGWDSRFPDGTPRKLLDSSRIRNLGWKPTIALREGLASTYEWFLSSGTNARL